MAIGLWYRYVVVWECGNDRHWYECGNGIGKVDLVCGYGNGIGM